MNIKIDHIDQSTGVAQGYIMPCELPKNLEGLLILNHDDDCINVYIGFTVHFEREIHGNRQYSFGIEWIELSSVNDPKNRHEVQLTKDELDLLQLELHNHFDFDKYEILMEKLDWELRRWDR